MKSWLHPRHIGRRGIDVGQPPMPRDVSHGLGLIQIGCSAVQTQLLAFMRAIINSILALRSALTFCICGRSPIILM